MNHLRGGQTRLFKPFSCLLGFFAISLSSLLRPFFWKPIHGGRGPLARGLTCTNPGRRSERNDASVVRLLWRTVQRSPYEFLPAAGVSWTDAKPCLCRMQPEKSPIFLVSGLSGSLVVPCWSLAHLFLISIKLLFSPPETETQIGVNLRCLVLTKPSM